MILLEPIFFFFLGGKSLKGKDQQLMYLAKRKKFQK